MPSPEPTSPPTFETNKAAFDAQLASLLVPHRGKFALFHNNSIVGVYDSVDTAYQTGVAQFGLDPIYIGRIDDSPEATSNPALACGLLRGNL